MRPDQPTRTSTNSARFSEDWRDRILRSSNRVSTCPIIPAHHALAPPLEDFSLTHFPKRKRPRSSAPPLPKQKKHRKSPTLEKRSLYSSAPKKSSPKGANAFQQQELVYASSQVGEQEGFSRRSGLSPTCNRVYASEENAMPYYNGAMGVASNASSSLLQGGNSVHSSSSSSWTIHMERLMIEQEERVLTLYNRRLAARKQEKIRAKLIRDAKIRVQEERQQQTKKNLFRSASSWCSSSSCNKPNCPKRRRGTTNGNTTSRATRDDGANLLTEIQRRRVLVNASRGGQSCCTSPNCKEQASSRNISTRSRGRASSPFSSKNTARTMQDAGKPFPLWCLPVGTPFPTAKF